MYTMLLLINHFVSDFLLQSRAMGKNKSSSIKYLFIHIAIIFVTFIPLSVYLLGPQIGLTFAVLNALVHMIIDASIWNLYKLSVRFRFGPNVIPSEYKYWEDHLFYSTIGLDQLLHVLTIVYLLGGV